MKVWFKEILLIGKEIGLIKLGNIYGTKVQANVSRHKAMSYEYVQKLEKQQGRIPKASSDKPYAKDQYNFTDPESRIMKTFHGFDQCFNGQGVVNDDMVITAHD